MAATQVQEREIEEFVSGLALLDGRSEGVDDAARVRLLTLLESLKAAAAAAQARVSVTFAESQREQQRAAGMPQAKIGAGVAEQIALARRESPTLGSRHLGLATALVAEMPHTMAALTAGALSEWRATLIARATAVLSEQHRREVDARLAHRLTGLSDKQVAAAANALAYELDPRSVVERHAYARGQRRVSIRPAPDTMAYLTALLPAQEAVAVYAALTRSAARARSEGDPRSADQVKADTLVERVTGQARADAVPVEIGLVMSDTTLTGDDHVPAMLLGYGPIPAALAREIVRDSVRPSETGRPVRPSGTRGTNETGRAVGLAQSVVEVFEPPDPSADDAPAADGWSGIDVHAAAVWVRRLYTDRRTGVITDSDRRRRLFPDHLRRLIVARDQWCRTPYCGAPIKHIDHAERFADGGSTAPDNAQGLCERCNQVKETPGWTVTTRRLPGDVVVIHTSTPTGVSYDSTAPPWHAA